MSENILTLDSGALKSVSHRDILKGRLARKTGHSQYK